MKAKKWVALLLAGALVLGITGCGGKDEDAATGGMKDTDKVASINDVEITYGELNEFISLSAFAAGQDMAALEAQPETMAYLRQAMLNNMISYEAMGMALKDQGKDITEGDYQEKLDEFLKNSKEALKDQTIGVETQKRYFNYVNYYMSPFNEQAEKEVTDADVKAYYDAHITDKYTSTAVTGEVSHILVDNEELANEIYDKLAGGADFAEMAAQYGTDGTKDKGGSLGVLAEDDANYDADFMKGAFALKSGEISKPVKTQFGYHLIKLDNRQEAGGVMPFESEKDSIRSTLVQEKFDEIVSGLVEKYKVEYYGEFKQEAGDAAE